MILDSKHLQWKHQLVSSTHDPVFPLEWHAFASLKHLTIISRCFWRKHTCKMYKYSCIYKHKLSLVIQLFSEPLSKIFFRSAKINNNEPSQLGSHRFNTSVSPEESLWSLFVIQKEISKGTFWKERLTSLIMTIIAVVVLMFLITGCVSVKCNLCFLSLFVFENFFSSVLNCSLSFHRRRVKSMTP